MTSIILATRPSSSRNEDKISETEVGLVQAADLVQLPIGECFAFVKGGQLYKLRFPLLDKPSIDHTTLLQTIARKREP